MGIRVFDTSIVRIAPAIYIHYKQEVPNDPFSQSWSQVLLLYSSNVKSALEEALCTACNNNYSIVLTNSATFKVLVYRFLIQVVFSIDFHSENAAKFLLK